MNDHTQSATKCRHCGMILKTIFADLGATPVSNDYLRPEFRHGAESYYPLRAYVCDSCRLVQLEDFRRADELFREDYAYWSSISTSWLAHANQYAGAMIQRFGLNDKSTVVEIASNDGYLLQFFKHHGTKVLGIEPCRSVAEYAIQEKGLPTLIEFFGEALGKRLAAEGLSADLAIANNVLAHVPDINDFVAGFRELLKPRGVSTFEFPHLLNLIRDCQFDTIYHEHFSYLSLLAADQLFTSNGLRVFDVETIPTHGGSLRLFVCRGESLRPRSPRVSAILDLERAAGLDSESIYLAFAEKIKESKRSILSLLIDIKREGKTIVGYGAPAKGNTLLNYCGIGSDFLEFTVDRSTQKQGLYLPGTRLAIRAPEAIDVLRPDYILVLPWNIGEEVMEQMKHVRDWGGQFILPIPHPRIR